MAPPRVHSNLGGYAAGFETIRPVLENPAQRDALADALVSGGDTRRLTRRNRGIHGIDLVAATQNRSIEADAMLGASPSWSVASGRTFLRTGGTTPTVSGGGAVEFGGAQELTGPGALFVNGGTLLNNLLGGAMDRSGTTTLDSGFINIQTSVNLFGNGTLRLNGVDIPRDAKPGVYCGEISVKMNDTSLKFPFAIKVLPVTIPVVKDWVMDVNCWMHPQATAHSYAGCTGHGQDEAQWTHQDCANSCGLTGIWHSTNPRWNCCGTRVTRPSR
jgi:hypothetical protein